LKPPRRLGKILRRLPGTQNPASPVGENEGYQLREGSAPYEALFVAENDDIGLENTHFWGVNSE